MPVARVPDTTLVYADIKWEGAGRGVLGAVLPARFGDKYRHAIDPVPSWVGSEWEAAAYAILRAGEWASRYVPAGCTLIEVFADNERAVKWVNSAQVNDGSIELVYTNDRVLDLVERRHIKLRARYCWSTAFYQGGDVRPEVTVLTFVAGAFWPILKDAFVALEAERHRASTAHDWQEEVYNVD
jgi:hypothetical protein